MSGLVVERTPVQVPVPGTPSPVPAPKESAAKPASSITAAATTSEVRAAVEAQAQKVQASDETSQDPLDRLRQAMSPFHRQLRIKTESLAAVLEFVDPNTRNVVMTVPLSNVAAGGTVPQDIVIGGIDLVV